MWGLGEFKPRRRLLLVAVVAGDEEGLMLRERLGDGMELGVSGKNSSTCIGNMRV